jgi:hypothetical protein
MKVACTSIVAAPRFRTAKSTERPDAAAGALPSTLTLFAQHAAARLRQDAVDDVTGDVGEAEVAPLVTVSQPLVVDAE